jgi:hypothetical protein
VLFKRLELILWNKKIRECHASSKLLGRFVRTDEWGNDVAYKMKLDL